MKFKTIDFNDWEEITEKEYFNLEGKKELLRILHDKAVCGTNIYFKRKAIVKLKTKEIIDNDGITYIEVDYNTYLNSINKHRIVKSLNSQYFVEVEEAKK
jgi:uncharacterized protein YjhX (UPF0386 family)